MKTLRPESMPLQTGKDWQKTQFANPVRYIPSGTYYARLRVKGKLVRKTLKTKAISVAKMKLVDLDRHSRIF